MKLARLLLLSLFLGVLILVGTSFLVGWRQALAVLENANLSFLALAGLFQFLAVVAVYARWRAFVDNARIRVNSWRLFSITLAGIGFSHLMPSSRMGGEPVRAFFLKKSTGKPASLCLSTIIAERIFDAVVFSFFALLTIIFALFYWDLPLFLVALLVLAFLISTFALYLMIHVSVNKKSGLKLAFWVFRRFQGFISRFKPVKQLEKRIFKGVEDYSTSTARLIFDKKMWLPGIGFTLLVWVFDVLRTFFVFKALGFQAGFLLIASVLVVAALAGAIPVSPGGLGLMEIAMIAMYSASNVPLVAAGLVTIVDRLFSFWAFTIIGLGAAWYLGVARVNNVSINGK